MASSENEDPAELFDEDDLFGDGDEHQSEQERALSDQELDSGDDEDRDDRAKERMDVVEEQSDTNDRHARIMDADFPRQIIPKASDGQLHVMRIPSFLGLDPKAYDPSTFTIPTADHHSTTRSAKFLASTTANTTIRYRKNPLTGEFESNTVMSRWSDGSVTIAVGDEVYELQPKPLAPPTGPGAKPYQDVLDSHQYLAAPYVTSQMLHIVGHITNQYTVVPNKEIQDHALEKLASGLAAAARGNHNIDAKAGLKVISSTQDPELQKKEAELAEKERLKAQRRRETAAARADQQTGRVRTSIGGGLRLDDLEGGTRLMGSKKKRAAPAGPRRPRRKADYDSDDDLPHGRSREDEYDLDDGFVAPSDEEIEGEEGDDDDESEEEIDEGSEDEKGPRPKKRKTDTAARNAEADAEGDSDLDAEGEIDDGGIQVESTVAGDMTAGRGRKRQVIEDDEDE